MFLQWTSKVTSFTWHILWHFHLYNGSFIYLHIHVLILNTLLLHGWSTDVFFLYSSWIPCLSWKVKLPTVLQKNSSGPTNSLVFQHLSRIWTLSNNDYMILRSIFSLWGQLRDSYTTITKGLNAHQCSRRKRKMHWEPGGENFLNLKIRVNWSYFFFYKKNSYGSSR